MDRSRRRAPDDAIPPDVLLRAYASGYFPMADARTGRIQWFTADPRAILPVDALHVPRRLRRTLRQGAFRCTRNHDFAGVVRACAARDETWIGEAIVRSYVRLHELGYAHSVEVWRENELVGGLYGVALGGAFFGESMFNHVPDAAKVALVHLVDHLRARGYSLLEIQMVTPLTAQFGPRLLSRREYLVLLDSALALDCRFGDSTPDPSVSPIVE